jgi:hypothetical protein
MYKNLYLKYYNKYKNLLYGGSIDEYMDLFNTQFDDKWILTGSEAIKKYVEFFEKPELFELTPNDVDIIVVQNDLIYSRNIGNYKRVQSQPEKSMTFQYNNKSFDVSTQKESISYYEINGIKLATPNDMLDDYVTNLELRGKKEEDTIKIHALYEIKNLIRERDLEKKQINNKRHRDDIENHRPNLKPFMGRTLFSDE